MKSLRRSLYGCIVALSLLSGIGLGCDALFRPFLEPSPQPCAAGCPVGQTCNADTQLCESPADLGSDLGGTSDGGPTVPTGLSLVAGGVGGSGNADDTGADARFSSLVAWPATVAGRCMCPTPRTTAFARSARPTTPSRRWPELAEVLGPQMAPAPTPGSTLQRAGARRGRQPVHRRQRQPRDPQAGACHACGQHL